MKVVPPVADLPIELPQGRRDSYPAEPATLQSLADRFGVQESCAVLLASLGA
jgi:hypothetical protein